MTGLRDDRVYEELGRLNNELVNAQRETVKKNIDLSRLAAIVESSEDAIACVDLSGAFTAWNLAAERLYGHPKAEVLGRSASDLSLPWPAGVVASVIETLRSGETTAPMEIAQILQDSTNRYIILAFSPVRDARGTLIGVSCFGRDITERKQTEEALRIANAKLEDANRRLEILANTDGLTGLSTHRVFHERLEIELQSADRYHNPLAVLMVDVDDFKSFNDAYGHPAGDVALKQVANLLQGAIRSTDIAARYGGEEFAVVLTQSDRHEALAAAERIRTAVASASWENRQVTVSVGVSCLPSIPCKAKELVARADKMLYRSKRAGKNRITQDCDESVPAAMMLLRQRTNAQHKAVEQTLAPLMGPISRKDYTMILERLLGFIQPLESRLMALAEVQVRTLTLESRLKAPLIIEDLQRLGVVPEELARLPRCSYLPEVSSTAEALGCLYVLEGATLGGRVVLRHVHNELGLDADTGASYFTSYGEDVGPMWRSFGRHVNQTCTRPDDLELLVRSATATFDALNRWMSEAEPGTE